MLPLTRGILTVKLHIRCIRRALLTLTELSDEITGNAKLAAVLC